MAPKYTVYYFDITALGEPIRYLLTYGKEDWEDKRYKDVDCAEWKAAKPTMPLGKMPVLEFDGKKFHQSFALARFLGAKYGLTGKDAMENLKIDIAADTWNEFRLAIVNWYFDPVEVSKKFREEPLLNTTIPFYMEKFAEMVTDNKGYLANGKLSWADIFLVASVSYYNSLVGYDLLAKYPILKDLQKKVESIPQIAAYIAKRPFSKK